MTGHVPYLPVLGGKPSPSISNVFPLAPLKGPLTHRRFSQKVQTYLAWLVVFCRFNIIVLPSSGRCLIFFPYPRLPAYCKSRVHVLVHMAPSIWQKPVLLGLGLKDQLAALGSLTREGLFPFGVAR